MSPDVQTEASNTSFNLFYQAEEAEHIKLAARFPLHSRFQLLKWHSRDGPHFEILHWSVVIVSYYN